MYAKDFCGNQPKAAAGNDAMAVMSTNQVEAPREGIVNGIANQLHSRLTHLHSLNARLESLGDRLLGAQPSQTDSGQVVAANPGELGNLGNAVPFIDYLLDGLERHVKRLEQL